MYIFNMKIYHFINKNNNNAKRYILSTIIKRNFSSQKQSIPTSIDAVVVGGGSLGTSCLYHLQKLGINTILLEKDKLTAGTTWHSAGMLWRLRPSDIDIELHAYTREMCKQLEIETDENTFSENGGLFIACNKERQTEYIRLHETGKYYGIESTILKPHDIVDIHPLINVDDVIGGIYSPGDGTIDPTGIVNAYAKGAKKLGGQIFENRYGNGGKHVNDNKHNKLKEYYSIHSNSQRKIYIIRQNGTCKKYFHRWCKTYSVWYIWWYI